MPLGCNAAWGKAPSHSLAVGKYRASAFCTVRWSLDLLPVTRKEEAIVFREAKARVAFSAIFEHVFFIKHFPKNTRLTLADASRTGAVPPPVEVLAADSP